MLDVRGVLRVLSRVILLGGGRRCRRRNRARPHDRKLNDFRRMMKGMSGEHPRWIALQGMIGELVYCSIYERRASVCREFPVSWEFGVPNERCDRARIAWGLEPLPPYSGKQPDDVDVPQAA